MASLVLKEICVEMISLLALIIDGCEKDGLSLDSNRYEHDVSDHHVSCHGHVLIMTFKHLIGHQYFCRAERVWYTQCSRPSSFLQRGGDRLNSIWRCLNKYLYICILVSPFLESQFFFIADPNFEHQRSRWCIVFWYQHAISRDIDKANTCTSNF